MSSKDNQFPAWVTAVYAVSRALGVLSACLILLGILVVCHMVFVRGVLGVSSIWQTEFTSFCILASTFLGAPYILLTRGHIGVDIVPMMVQGKARLFLYLFGSFIGLLFCFFFLYSSIPWFYEAWVTGLTTSSVWSVKVWIPYSTVPIGLFILCLQFLAEIWLVITKREQPFGMAANLRL